MKNLIQKSCGWIREKATVVFAWLNAIAKDKYQHFTLGVVIAAAGLIAGGMLWQAVFPECGSLLVAFLASVVTVLAAAIWKDCRYDAIADVNDIAATVAGGAIIWTVVVFAIFFA